MPTIEELEKQLADEKKKVSLLERKLSLYEENGTAKLFYSLNRKMNEMADLMNKTSLSGIDLDSKDSKEFERLFKLLEKSSVISVAANTIQTFAGISGDEEKDTSKKTFQRITAESIADVLRDTERNSS